MRESIIIPRFHTISFGCRANQADAAALEEDLLRRGFRAAGDPAQAEIVVLNSCTVTAAADAELRQTVRRIHRSNPAAQILVTGCYAQRCPEELRALPGVQWVVGNSHKTGIGKLLSGEHAAGPASPSFVPLETLLPGKSELPPESGTSEWSCTAVALGSPGANGSARIFVGDVSAQRTFAVAPVIAGAWGDRTRPNLKIQDGCNSRCSFCVIPQVRGRSRSLPLSDALDHFRALSQAGYREVVLSGINLGQYGRDLSGRPRLAQFIRSILAETSLERLRLSSVEPMDFTDELLDLMAATGRIAKHVHAPLQSGSEKILRRMRRKYRPRDYQNRILAAWERMPDAACGADVMVGFPGESEEDFAETRHLIESLPFTYLHVFPFSARPGTPAATMSGQVDAAAIGERSRILRELSREKNRQFRERQLGRRLTVLTLGESAPSETSALSDHYLRVSIPGEPLPANQWVSVRIAALTENGLVGTNEATGEAAGAGFSQPLAASLPSTSTCATA